MEQQGALPGLCQVCYSPAEQPSPWLASDLRLSGWFDSVVKKGGVEGGGGFLEKGTNKE